MRKLKNIGVLVCCLCFFSSALGQIEVPENQVVTETTWTAKQLDSIKLREANILAYKKLTTIPENTAPNSASTKQLNYQNNTVVVDTMEYRIDRTFSKEQLRALVLDINKKHTAILSYKEVEYNANDEIVAMKLELIDSRLRASSYKVVKDSIMKPLMIYEYPNGRSGFMPITPSSTREPIPQAILDRIAAQEAAAEERARLKKEKASTPTKPAVTKNSKKPKIIVRSSHTIPDSLLPKAQQKLRAKIKH